jgi:opacity protein-like surface antigen
MHNSRSTSPAVHAFRPRVGLRQSGIVLAFISLGFSPLLLAQAQPWYLSAKAGVTEFELAEAFQSSIALPAAQYQSDLKDTSVQLGLGYQLSPNFALELHYGDLGEVQLSANSALPPVQIDSKLETQTVALDFVASFPATGWLDVYAKIGAVHWDIDADTTLIDRLDSSLNNRSQVNVNGVSAKFGVGVRFDLNEKLALGLELEQFNAGERDLTGRERLRMANASLIYRF